MNTSDYLIQHARDNVWCTPDQDFQVILAPARISPPQGIRNNIRVLWTTINLPTKTDWYHVYQVGEITPKLLGLLNTQNNWITLQEHANKEWVLSDVYTKSGIQFPRFETYVLRTVDNNVLIAIKDQPTLRNLGKESVYIRFYSNVFFSRASKVDGIDGIQVRGTKILNSVHLMQFQGGFRNSLKRKGHTYVFVNGYLRHDVNVTTVKIGDIVEFVWDSSIKEIVELPIATLPSYYSSLDQKQKYLIHPEGTLGETIEYRDDIDVFLIHRNSDYIYDGVYYHKNQEDAVRMLTHRDYGLPVPYVNGYVQDHPVWNDVNRLSVRLHIRESGYHRPLVDEHHRIKELYKLPRADRILAMTGTESSLWFWHCENLEKSFYPAIMRSKGIGIDREMVQRAYGYNAISKLIGDSPIRLPDMKDYVRLPFALRKDSTIYEYDDKGKLLGHYHHVDGYYYPTRHPECRLIEGIVGIGTYSLPTQYQKREQKLNSQFSYRFYTTDIFANAPTDNWRDVTGSDAVTISDGTARWNTDPAIEYSMVRDDSHFLAYSLLLNYRDGVLKFTVNAREQRTDGTWSESPVLVPFARVDIWLNGRALIENLDYFVQWPEICIVNKEYVNFSTPDAEQKITVRAYGHCSSDLEREPVADYGFVTSGLLSKNKRFDIRDDKVVRIVVEGAVFERSDFTFSEDDNGVRTSAARNGAPYQITHEIVPLRGTTNKETYLLREESKRVDGLLSDFLTQRLPEPREPLPNPIPRLYQIYSPFCSKVMYDLLHGIIVMDDFKGQYSDMMVKDRLEEYKHLLAYEPTFKDIDFDYVIVHPHNLYTEVTLNVYQYRFLLRAVRLFLNDKVDLTRFVKIETGFSVI